MWYYNTYSICGICCTQGICGIVHSYHMWYFTHSACGISCTLTYVVLVVHRAYVVLYTHTICGISCTLIYVVIKPVYYVDTNGMDIFIIL